MNGTHPPRRILRSIGALFAGFLVVVVLSLGTDMVRLRTRQLGEAQEEPPR
jgi:hypothetical protein